MAPHHHDRQVDPVNVKAGNNAQQAHDVLTSLQGALCVGQSSSWHSCVGGQADVTHSSCI